MKPLFIVLVAAMVAACSGKKTTQTPQPVAVPEAPTVSTAAPTRAKVRHVPPAPRAPSNAALTPLSPELEAFVQDSVRSSKYRFNEARMRQVLSTVTKVDRALSLSGAYREAAGKKPKKTPYPVYLKRFLDEPRPSNAIEFSNQYADALARAQARYGVPKSVILAIIGVETNYGRIMGDFRVVDVLYSLGFNFPRRASFFKGELAALFELEQRANIDISQVQGSFAGAMGYGQFMPSSYINYAVDFNDDGRIDLLEDPVDAIGSVAAYLSRHGWKRGLPGISQQPSGGKLFAAQTTGQANNWYAGANFRVIKRYNNSDRYALAVLLLAEDIKSRLAY